MIKQFTNNKEIKYLFVVVPEDANMFAFDSNIWYTRLFYFTDKWNWIKLPKGNYEKTGLSKDLITEEQWKEIVERENDKKFIRYSDYTRRCNTVTEYGLSLIKSLGFKENDNVLVLKVKS